MQQQLVECPNCGWVHFSVDETYVVNWEKTWEKTWTSLKDHYETKPTREVFMKCFRCGCKETTSFFLTKKTLEGSTVQPILIDKCWPHKK
jgi:hypothetical protein